MTRQRGALTRRQQRQAQVVALYCEGQTVRAIAATLGISNGTIDRDLKAARANWEADSQEKLDAKRRAHIAKINHLLRIAYEAWHGSAVPEEISTSEIEQAAAAEGAANAAAGKQRAGQRTRTRLKEKKYLETIQWCLGELAKIEGVYAPTKVAPTSPDGDNPWEPSPEWQAALEAMTPEQRQALRSLRTQFLTLQGTARVVGGADDTAAPE